MTLLDYQFLPTDSEQHNILVPLDHHFFTQCMISNKWIAWTDTWMRETRIMGVSCCSLSLVWLILHLPLAACFFYLYLSFVQHLQLKKWKFHAGQGTLYWKLFDSKVGKQKLPWLFFPARGKKSWYVTCVTETQGCFSVAVLGLVVSDLTCFPLALSRTLVRLGAFLSSKILPSCFGSRE